MPEPLPDFITLVVRDGWSALTEGQSARQLAREVLPAFLANQRWFGAKDLQITGTTARAHWAELRCRSRQLPAGRGRGPARRRRRAATLLPAARDQLRRSGSDPRLAAPVVLARPGSARRQGRRAVRRDGGSRLSARRVRRDAPAAPSCRAPTARSGSGRPPPPAGSRCRRTSRSSGWRSSRATPRR